MKIENTEGYMTDGEPEYMYVEFDMRLCGQSELGQVNQRFEQLALLKPCGNSVLVI